MSLKASHTVWLSDRNGTRIQPIENFVGSAALAYTRVVNEITPLTLTLPLNSTYTELFKEPSQYLDWRIEVWRRLGDGEEYLDTETIWFIRDVKKSLNPKTLTITAYSANEILNRRIIAFKSGTSGAQKTDNIDDIMKAYVRENIGASASASRNYSAYMTVAGDLGQGVSITKAASFDGLLETLQALSQQSFTQGTTPVPIFFDVIGVTTASGVANLEFATYKNQRGLDRTYTGQAYSVTLSEETQTLDNVEITYSFADEINYVFVGGAGEGSLRAVEEVSDTTRIAYSPINRREAFVNYTNSNVAAVLQSQGYQKLREGKPRKIITADIRNTDAGAYGRDWGFGDKMTASVDGEVFDVHIVAVAVSIQGGKETIKAAIRGEL